MSTVQASLFDFGAPAYWHRLRERQEKLMKLSRAPNTTSAYAQGWKVFSKWCAETGCTAFPASPDTVRDFLVWGLYERERRYRLNTMELTLTAISQYHTDHEAASPITPEVRGLLHTAARDLKERRGGKEAMTPRLLRRICHLLQREGSNVAIRDRAMILLQFAAGWRRSEIAGPLALRVCDVRFHGQGVVLHLGASKSDQSGRKGRVVGIQYGDRELTCPVRALRRWIAVRGRWPGPLFCRLSRHDQVIEKELTPKVINQRLKRALVELGQDPQRFGSHSLRSGMVTEAIRRGASESLIILRTGHASLKALEDYVRPAQAFKGNPLAGVL